jgi:hypothetical protein
MAQFSIPHPGKTLTDSGPYSSDQWAKVWRDFMSGILRDNASIIINSGNGVDEALWVEETSPASTQVQVNIGSALVTGYWYGNDAIVNLQIAPNNDASGDDRIDLIILRLDITNGECRLAVLQGTVAPVPVAPTMTRNATIWEVQIAEIAVTNGFTSIVNADIDNTVREYASLWHWKQGGTNQSTYTNRAKLMGQVDNSLDVELLSHFSVRRTTAGAALANGAWQTLPLTDDVDPDGLVSVAANQMTFLKAGWYTAQMNLTGVGSTASFGQARLRNITAGATLSVAEPVIGISTGTTRFHGMFQKTFEIPADNTVVELQIYHSAGNFTPGLDAAAPASGEASNPLNIEFDRWG